MPAHIKPVVNKRWHRIASANRKEHNLFRNKLHSDYVKRKWRENEEAIKNMEHKIVGK